MRRPPSRSRNLLAALAAAALAACGGGGDGDGGGPLNITTTTAADGVIGAAYNETIATTGGRGAKSFSIGAGALPAGLAMSAAGAITGTPTGPVGTANFTVTVTDSAGMPATDSQTLSIDIVEPLEITTAALAGTAVGEIYDANVAATGGTPPHSFSVSAGEAPAGLSVAEDGTISGQVATSATTETFTVEVADSSTPQFTATQSYTIAVQLEIATGALADATGGVQYSDALVARGGVPPYAWTLTAGSLPAGLAMGADGVISGTPDTLCAAASASLSVDVTDSATPAATVSRSGIDLTVNPATLDITTAALPGGRVDLAYNQPIVATGGVPSYTFAVTDGSLPSQLSLNAGNGRITGTPDTIETQAFEVTVTDSCPNNASQPLSLTISAASLGRNDSIATATVLPGDDTYQGSISPSGHPNTVFDPDEDYYQLSTTATSTVTIDINAQVNGSPLDSVIEVVNAAGIVLNLCGGPNFTSQCISDDEQLGVQLDARLQLRVSGATTFYIHVVDWGSDARPDMLYDLVITGVN